MKNLSVFALLAIAFMVFSCDAKKVIAENSASDSKLSENTNCPEDGVCTTQLFKNKKLEVKTDEFGSTYYHLSESKQTSVIVYQYKRNVEKGLQDGQYTEEIIFEINHSGLTTNIYSDLDLQKTKMLYGRLCFCRGQTGYYKVITGNLKLEQRNNEVKFTLDFKITQVPQVINSVHASIK